MSFWRTSLPLSALALGSQLLQLLLQFLIARFYGTGPQVDAYAAAVTAPQLAVALLLSTSAQLVVPALSKSLAESREQFLEGRNALLLWGVLLGSGMALLMVAFPHAIIGVLTPGLSGEAATLAPRYLCWAAAALAPAALSSYLSQSHNLRERYRIPAFVGLASAALLPAGFFALHEKYGFEVLLVLQAALALLQALVLLAGELRFGRGPLQWRHPVVSEMARASLPVILVAMAARVNLAVDRYFASFLPAGRLAILHYADRWVLLTQAVLGAPVVAVLYTRMARAHAGSPEEAAAGREAFAAMLYLGIPLAVGTFIAAPELSVALLSGKDAGQSIPLLVGSLQAYCGVLALGGFGSILVRAYYVRGHLWQVALVAGAIPMILNVILDALLVQKYGVVGLAAVSSLNSFLGVPLAVYLLVRMAPGSFGEGLPRKIVRDMLAATLSFAAIAYPARALAGGEVLVPALGRLALIFILGSTLYLFVSRFFGSEEAREILGILRKDQEPERMGPAGS